MRGQVQASRVKQLPQSLIDQVAKIQCLSFFRIPSAMGMHVQTYRADGSKASTPPLVTDKVHFFT